MSRPASLLHPGGRNADKPLEMHVNDLLKIAAESGASDLHLKVGTSPMMRVRGALVPADKDARLTHEDMVGMAAAVLPAGHREKFKENHEIDLAYSVAGLGRFRCNAFQQRGTIGLIFRVIPMRVSTIDDLALPRVLKRIAAEERGLVLVTGTTGSGKTTTLAAMIDSINQTQPCHIVTIEDPIEFVFKNKKAMINQREVGSDTHSFNQALKHVLRQDPNVILIGEMRDLETIEIALTVAETGHLVFATLHTPDSVQSINRIIDVFPAHQQQQVRVQCSFVLQGVICQQLMPRIGGGLVLGAEILIATPAIRNLIRESKAHQIYSAIQMGQREGMRTLNMSLAELVRLKKVSKEVAISRSSDVQELERLLASK